MPDIDKTNEERIERDFQERMRKKQEAEDAAEELRKENEREKLRQAYMRRRGLL